VTVRTSQWGYIEVTIRRATGTISWLMKLQNTIASTQSHPSLQLPLSSLSQLSLPAPTYVPVSSPLPTPAASPTDVSTTSSTITTPSTIMGGSSSSSSSSSSSDTNSSHVHFAATPPQSPADTMNVTRSAPIAARARRGSTTSDAPPIAMGASSARKPSRSSSHRYDSSSSSSSSTHTAAAAVVDDIESPSNNASAAAAGSSGGGIASAAIPLGSNKRSSNGHSRSISGPPAPIPLANKHYRPSINSTGATTGTGGGGGSTVGSHNSSRHQHHLHVHGRLSSSSPELSPSLPPGTYSPSPPKFLLSSSLPSPIAGQSLPPATVPSDTRSSSSSSHGGTSLFRQALLHRAETGESVVSLDEAMYVANAPPPHSHMFHSLM
jgi:hypothetical protein